MITAFTGKEANRSIDSSFMNKLRIVYKL